MEKEKISTMLNDLCVGKDTTSMIDDRVVAKIGVSKEFDYLYHSEYLADTLSFDTRLEFFGFYNKTSKKLYLNDTYPFSRIPNTLSISDTLTIPAKSKIVSMFNEWANSISVEEALANGGQVEEYFVKYRVDSLARQAILSGTTSQDYKPNYSLNKDKIKFTTNDVLDLSKKSNDVVDRYLAEFKESEKEYVYSYILENTLVREKIEEYEQDPTNTIFTLSKMRKVLNIDKMNMVTITICKDDKTLTFKYPTINLYWGVDENYLSTYNIPAKEREEYYLKFGRITDFSAKDIVKITYSGKTLFEK